MVCLFHSDYGPADPAFKFDPGSTVGVRGWIVGASSFKEARNIGEVEAIQRQLLAETLAPVGPQGPPARRSARLVTVAARPRGSLLWTTGTSCDCACNSAPSRKRQLATAGHRHANLPGQNTLAGLFHVSGPCEELVQPPILGNRGIDFILAFPCPSRSPIG